MCTCNLYFIYLIYIYVKYLPHIISTNIGFNFQITLVESVFVMQIKQHFSVVQLLYCTGQYFQLQCRTQIWFEFLSSKS